MTTDPPGPAEPAAAGSFRCAAASLDRGDDLAGTASTVTAFLLLEHAGPWGNDAFRDSRLPAALGPALKRHAVTARVRPLLVRRSGRGGGTQGGVRIFAAHAGGPDPWLETAVVPDLEAVFDLDLARLRAGESLGLDRVTEPLYAACTHGRHDTCCAERGRPLALALAQRAPEQTWECSHIGGDRFAGNLLVLPHGLYYGRLLPQDAPDLVALTEAGRLDLDHLRGRSSVPMAVQAAEILLRRELGESRLGAVGVGPRHVEGDRTRVALSVDGQVYEVTVRTSPAPAPARLTCKAIREDPVPRHELVSISRS